MSNPDGTFLNVVPLYYEEMLDKHNHHSVSIMRLILSKICPHLKNHGVKLSGRINLFSNSKDGGCFSSARWTVEQQMRQTILLYESLNCQQICSVNLSEIQCTPVNLLTATNNVQNKMLVVLLPDIHVDEHLIFLQYIARIL